MAAARRRAGRELGAERSQGAPLPPSRSRSKVGAAAAFDACPIDRVGDLGALAAAGLTDMLVDASLLDEAETDAVLDRVAEVRA